VPQRQRRTRSTDVETPTPGPTVAPVPSLKPAARGKSTKRTSPAVEAAGLVDLSRPDAAPKKRRATGSAKTTDHRGTGTAAS
jgi:hypothetical protein